MINKYYLRIITDMSRALGEKIQKKFLRAIDRSGNQAE
jgi:hypothetical protein